MHQSNIPWKSCEDDYVASTWQFSERPHRILFKKPCSCKNRRYIYWNMEYSCWKGSVFLACRFFFVFNMFFFRVTISFIQYERMHCPWSIVSIILQRVLPNIMPYTPGKPILSYYFILFQKECCICKRITCWNKGSFLKRILHLPQGGAIFWRTSPRLSTHSWRNTIHFGLKRTRTPSWNLKWCFSVWGRLVHPFSKRWCTFLKEICQIVINSHFKECHDHLKKTSYIYNIYIYIYTTWILLYFEMVLDFVSRRLHTFYRIVCVLNWRSFSNYILLHSFQIDVMHSFKGTHETGHTFFTEYHVLWKIQFGITEPMS